MVSFMPCPNFKITNLTNGRTLERLLLTEPVQPIFNSKLADRPERRDGRVSAVYPKTCRFVQDKTQNSKLAKP